MDSTDNETDNKSNENNWVSPVKCVGEANK